MIRMLPLLVSAAMLQGCAGMAQGFVTWVEVHKGVLAATGIVAGTVSTVGGALVQVDEVESRIERRIEEKPR